MAGDTQQVSGSPSFLRDFSRGFERLPWWWVAGSSLMFLLAIVLGDAVQTDDHMGSASSAWPSA
jgi:hypothetical protein